MEIKPFDEGFTDGELLLWAGYSIALFMLGAFAMWMYMGGGL